MSIIDDVVGLCHHCEHRFRRVFEPFNLEDFQDNDGNPISDYLEDGDVIILDLCLLTDIPMGKDITHTCSHFSPKEDESSDEDNKFTTLFKHLK